ncbi:MAG TPA: EamA family transporter RarD [Gemmataceae bacterium]|nr:EamA family transporter RarD [Gemmataceae bacterium]
MSSGDSRSGWLYGIGAYGFWGLVPVYFFAVREVPALELLAQRIVWSTVLLALILSFIGGWKALGHCLATPRIRNTLLLTTILIAGNWYVYIYGVTTERVMQTSLGYFIAPLVNNALGIVVLRERLRLAQTLALILACLGVVVLTVSTWEFPWIALVLAVSFSLYGLFRKTVAADALTGLSVEALLLLPVALGYVLWLQHRGEAKFAHVDRATDALLIAGSVITVLPLFCFAQAARRLRLTTLGFLQYLSPTGQFLLSIVVFHEAFTREKLLGFSFIWAALAVYSADAVWGYRQRRGIIMHREDAKDSKKCMQ